MDFLPSDWFTRKQSALLVAYTNHVVRLAKIEAALNDLDPVKDIEIFNTLSRLAAGEWAKLLAHGRAMRLTVQSKLKAETAHGHPYPRISQTPTVSPARPGDYLLDLLSLLERLRLFS